MCSGHTLKGLKMGRYPSGLRNRPANPVFVGSNPTLPSILEKFGKGWLRANEDCFIDSIKKREKRLLRVYSKRIVDYFRRLK